MNGELRAKREALEILWRQGLSGKALLLRHSQLIDDYLSDSFARCPGAKRGMTLLALGGYGRQELFPFSDIDLLLLYDREAEDELPAVTEAIFYPLWDAGLEVGHGVRTVDACIADSKEDFFLQVALLDARRIVGSDELFAALKDKHRKRFIEGHRRDFLQNMVHHRTERHQRYGLHSYQLEPNVKENRGGFRDIQAMLWVAHVVYGLHGLPDLENAGLLTETERENFDAARDSLIRIRNRLHYISGRKNDQLYFEHQEEMAKAFRYRNSNGMLGVEHFMRDVYGHLQTIAMTTDLFFEHVDETVGLSPVSAKEHVLEPGITVINSRIHLADHELLKKRPYLLMRIFAHAAKTGFDIHHRTSKIINANLSLVDDKLRRSKRMAKAFLEALQAAKDPAAVLSTLLDTGLLVAYIPEFAGIVSLAQHDVYHIYTVDRHLLQTVSELTKLLRSEERFVEISSPHILYLAALFHDIGKGHSQDHSHRGAETVQVIGERLGLPEKELSCLVFLVRYHLFLTVGAQRRDLEDEAFILQCAKEIKDPDRLHMLYLLSIADAKATGPAAWNEWKGALLLELYLRIANLLERSGSDLVAPDKAEGALWMRNQVEQLLEEEPVVDLESLPEDYLLSFTPETIVAHLQHRKQLRDNESIIHPENRQNNWSILVMAPDSTGLLAKICGTLALHNLNVVGAQIFTWLDGTAVDILDVRPEEDLPYEAMDWSALKEDLDLAVVNRLGLRHRLVDKYRPSLSGTKRMGLRPDPKVIFDNEESELYTIIEVFAEDRPGLLYDITRTLADFEINISRAKIGMARDQVVDVFYTLDRNGQKIIDTPFEEEVKQALSYEASKNYS